MDVLIGSTWSLYPAILLVVLGAVLALRGAMLEVSGLKGALKGDASKNLTWIRGFRLSILGLALAGVGASWLWSLKWLLILSLAIGGEEILESSLVIYGLKRSKKLKNDSSASV